MLTCVICNRKYHKSCVPRLYAELDEKDWNCPNCHSPPETLSHIHPLKYRDTFGVPLIHTAKSVPLPLSPTPPRTSLFPSHSSPSSSSTLSLSPSSTLLHPPIFSTSWHVPVSASKSASILPTSVPSSLSVPLSLTRLYSLSSSGLSTSSENVRKVMNIANLTLPPATPMSSTSPSMAPSPPIVSATSFSPIREGIVANVSRRDTPTPTATTAATASSEPSALRAWSRTETTHTFEQNNRKRKLENLYEIEECFPVKRLKMFPSGDEGVSLRFGASGLPKTGTRAGSASHRPLQSTPMTSILLPPVLSSGEHRLLFVRCFCWRCRRRVTPRARFLSPPSFVHRTARGCFAPSFFVLLPRTTSFAASSMATATDTTFFSFLCLCVWLQRRSL